jgi:hypothetical protein
VWAANGLSISPASKATIKAHTTRHIARETTLVVIECCIDTSCGSSPRMLSLSGIAAPSAQAHDAVEVLVPRRAVQLREEVRLTVGDTAPGVRYVGRGCEVALA